MIVKIQASTGFEPVSPRHSSDASANWATVPDVGSEVSFLSLR